MKKCITMLLLILVSSVFAEPPIFKSDFKSYSTGASLSDIKTPAGQWLKVPYGFRVVKFSDSKAVSSHWKGFKSHYKLNKPLFNDYTFTFSFNRTADRNDGSVLVRLGGRQAGIWISGKGLIRYFDAASSDKYKFTKLPSSSFKAEKGRWYTVRFDVRPNTQGIGKYDINIDGKSLATGIAFPAFKNSMTGGFSLQASSAPKQGGKSILLKDFIITPIANSDKKAPRFAVQITPTPDRLGSCFVYGKPMGFDVTLKNYFDDKGTTVTWSISPYYNDKDIIDSGDLELGQNGIGSIRLKELSRKGYWLNISQFYKGKLIKKKKHSFAVLSETPPKPDDINDEWMGLVTHLEYNAPGSKQFERDLAIIKQLGIWWIRMNHQIDWYYTKKGKEKPIINIEGRGRLADRLTKEGMGWIESIQSMPQWLSSAPADGIRRWKYPPKDWNLWSKYLEALVTRLKDTPAQYMVGCEPCSFWSVDRALDRWPGGLIEAVARYGRLSEKIIHNISPDAVFIGPSASSGASQLARQVLKNYGTFYDQISFHYPKWANSFRSVSQGIYRDVQKYADHNLPLLSTEAPSISGTLPWTEERLAVGMKNYIRLWAEGIVYRNYSFLLRHPRVSDAPGGCYFTADFQPRPGVVVLQTLVAKTRNAKFIARLDLGSNLEGYLFTSKGKKKLCLWSKGGDPEPLPTELITAGLKAYDMYNNELPTAGLKIGREVIFLDGVNADNDAQIRPYKFQLVDKQTFPVKLTLTNFGKTNKQVNVVFDNISIEVSPSKISKTLLPGEVLSVNLKVKANQNRLIPFKTTALRAKVNGKEQSIAYVYYFDEKRTKTIDVGAFAPDSKLWHSGSAGSHRDYGKKIQRGPKSSKSTNFCRIKPNPTQSGSYIGLCHVEVPSQKRGWQSVWFNRVPVLKLPGIPFRVRFKVKATTKMIPSTFALLVRFTDAKGKIIAFHGLAPWVYPNSQNKFRTYEALLDSPVSMQVIHHQSGGDRDITYYPLSFKSFSINPTPDRPSGVWIADIEIESIEVDYYEPVKKVKKLRHHTDDNTLPIAGGYML